MTQAAHLSPIQYAHQQDGRITVEGLPNVNIHTIAEQGAEWEAMARPHSLTSGRRIRFVLMDESVTRLQGNPRLQPQHVMLPYPMRCPLTLSHTGFVVGTVFSFLLIREQDREALQGMGIDHPDFTEGQWILSEAELFNSSLADKAWQGLRAQIFSHTCPVLFTGEPSGGGQLIEVALMV